VTVMNICNELTDPLDVFKEPWMSPRSATCLLITDPLYIWNWQICTSGKSQIPHPLSADAFKDLDHSF